MWRFALVGSLLVVLGGAMVGIGGASADTSVRVFYLAMHPRQCLIVPRSGVGKTVLVVPCSNPAHNEEVFAIRHGGWGHRTPPSVKAGYALVRSLCFAAFRQLTGHQLVAGQGWYASWPDPGAETARYGDKVICQYRAFPQRRPLGSGWHVH
jgi:hypothetical protein